MWRRTIRTARAASCAHDRVAGCAATKCQHQSRAISSSTFSTNLRCARVARPPGISGSINVRIDRLPIDLRALESPTEQYPLVLSLPRAEREHPAAVQDPNV